MDLAVVGGGFTGLWAALQALEDDPARAVMVLEATRVAEGASGRNGGFADPSLTHGVANGLHHFPEQIDRLQELGRANLGGWVAALAAHAIEARYEPTGKLEVANAPWWVDSLREHRALLERFGEPALWMDRDRARAELDSPSYHAALWHRNGGIVDPARLCWGLAEAVRRLGGRVCEATPVAGMRREGERVELRTPHARVRARRVVLATNAYRSPLRRVRRASIPVWDYVLATEPLSAAQKAALGWKHRQGVGDQGNQFHYYRLTDDDRILWGGYDAVYHYASDTRPACENRSGIYETLARHLFETFPQLEGLRFSHRWAGPIATTTRFCLDAGRALGGRVAWAGGYTGLGVVTSRFGARAALDLLERADAPYLGLHLVSRRPFPWPPEPLRYLVVALTRRELARADANRGRRGVWLRLLDRLRLGFDS